MKLILTTLASLTIAMSANADETFRVLPDAWVSQNYENLHTLVHTQHGTNQYRHWRDAMIARNQLTPITANTVVHVFHNNEGIAFIRGHTFDGAPATLYIPVEDLGADLGSDDPTPTATSVTSDSAPDPTPVPLATPNPTPAPIAATPTPALTDEEVFSTAQANIEAFCKQAGVKFLDIQFGTVMNDAKNTPFPSLPGRIYPVRWHGSGFCVMTDGTWAGDAAPGKFVQDVYFYIDAFGGLTGQPESATVAEGLFQGKHVKIGIL
jgi:hypothetical protein